MIWYLSFSDTDGWKGAIHTEADSFPEAVQKTWRLGINPGGEVAGCAMAPETFEHPNGAKILQLLDRLLTRAEMEAIFGELVRIEDGC